MRAWLDCDVPDTRGLGPQVEVDFDLFQERYWRRIVTALPDGEAATWFRKKSDAGLVFKSQVPLHNGLHCSKVRVQLHQIFGGVKLIIYASRAPHFRKYQISRSARKLLELMFVITTSFRVAFFFDFQILTALVGFLGCIVCIRDLRYK